MNTFSIQQSRQASYLFYYNWITIEVILMVQRSVMLFLIVCWEWVTQLYDEGEKDILLLSSILLTVTCKHMHQNTNVAQYSQKIFIFPPKCFSFLFLHFAILGASNIEQIAILLNTSFFFFSFFLITCLI